MYQAEAVVVMGPDAYVLPSLSTLSPVNKFSDKLKGVKRFFIDVTTSSPAQTAAKTDQRVPFEHFL